VRLTAGCGVEGATPVLSAEPGAKRYVLVERTAPRLSTTRFDVFSGGCVTMRLTMPTENRTQLIDEAAQLLGYTRRQALAQALEQRSDGRLQLNPGQPR
jgi:hypothetical protein